ncbi:MAG: hypothetical protein HKL80_10730 [Acidimicrobiales bacterium]|nr:hypothetical protein [Acidimicrobiales bacterium]
MKVRFILVILATIVAGIVGIAMFTGSHKSTISQSPPVSSLESRMVAFAKAEGSNMGGKMPLEVAWVATDRKTANEKMAGSTSDSDEPVYVVLITGIHFTCNSCPAPYGAPAPSGNDLIFIIDQSTFKIVDSGLQNGPQPRAEMDSMGTVTSSAIK